MKRLIVAFAFGCPAEILPNQIIAKIATDYLSYSKDTIFTQKDIVPKTTSKVVRCSEEDGNPPPTLRIAKEAILYAVENNFQHIVVVAAGPHKKRALRDVVMMMKQYSPNNYISINLAPAVNNYKKEFWFSEESTQERTRSFSNWFLREAILNLMPFWLYKKVAS